MLSNKNIAYFWLAVVYLIIVVLGFFKATESIYHPQINDIPVWFRTYQNIINQSSLVLIVFFITLVFENTKNFALNRLDEKNKIIAREKEISENLLLNILPYESAQELKLKGHSDARLYDYISVLFTDFKDFTIKSETLSPQALVAELDTCFRAFDLIMERHGIEKIKTIGDGYVAASGLPTENISHAENIVRAALDIRNFMSERRKEKGAATFEVRIGINSGPVVAGIVGVKKFAYDIWGDTVNIAARMEQNSEVGKINISQSTYELVKDKFTCTYRGKIDAKNKGQIDMYFVEA
jgi:class 3 adenylate cyclase